MEFYSRNLGKIENSIALFLGNVARKCAINPKKTLVIYVVCCLALMTGVFFAFEFENRAPELWVDVNSIPRTQLEETYEVFGKHRRTITLFISSKNDGSNANVLTEEAMTEAFMIHDAVINTKTSSGNQFKDLCGVKLLDECLIDSATAFWDHNSTLYKESIANSSDPDNYVATQCAQETYPFSGIPVPRLSSYSNFRLIENNTKALTRAYIASYPLVGEFDGSIEELLDLEAAVIKLVTEEFVFESLDVYITTTRSFDDALAANISGDIILYGASILFMILFASISLGKSCSIKEGRVLIACIDILFIMFAAGAAYGTMLFIGKPMQALVQILPFILLGVGIDSSYVMAAGFDHSDSTKPIEERLFDAAFKNGMSITVTSGTNIVALLFGSLTKIQAVSYFCLYAAVSFFYLYIGHLTAFVALLALDAQRKNSNRIDCCFCVRLQDEEAKSQSTVSSIENETDLSSTTYNGTDLQDIKEGRLNSFFGNVFGPLLMKPYVKVSVLVLFITLSCVCGYLIPHITTEFAPRILTPDDSYQREFYDAGARLFGADDGSRIPTSLYVGNVDYASCDVQKEIDRLSRLWLLSDTVDEALGNDNWLIALRTFANLTSPFSNNVTHNGDCLPGDTFYLALGKFLELPQNNRFSRSIVFDPNDNETIIMSRINYQHVLLDDAEIKVQAIEDAQKIAQTSYLSPQPFIVHYVYQFYDTTRIIIPETVQGLLLSLVSVVIIASFFLVHPVLVFIAAIVLGMILTVLLATLVFWQIDLNNLSAVNLIMAVGLVIDYSAHILHYFGSTDSSLSKDERVLLTMREMAPPVFLGACTTLIGVLPLSFSNSEVFRIFQKQFVSIVLVGASHGLVLLPVILSLIGPSIHHEKKQEKVEESGSIHRPSMLTSTL